MIPEQSIISVLTNDGPVSAVIGNRVYSGYAPQDAAMPFAVIGRNGTEVDHHMGGASGLRQVDISIDIYGESYTVLVDLADNIEAALDTANDRQGDIARLWITDQSDEQIELPDGKGRPIRVIRQTYGMHYNGN